ncbi:MAG: hypothetical protein LUG50_13150 [Planctomycetaceae bacterium]|nr:hypothetical protein [Planctomycetaceae bacterium]
MIIRPIAAAHFLGELGRSAEKRGAQGGPTAFSGRDEVELGVIPKKTGLYSATPFFKMMGRVELMSDDAHGAARNELTDNQTAV